MVLGYCPIECGRSKSTIPNEVRDKLHEDDHRRTKPLTKKPFYLVIARSILYLAFRMIELRYLFFLLSLFLLGSCKKDQLQWQKVQQLTSNTSAQLNHIRFINDSVCIIEGGIQWHNSEILRSTDGGYTWKAFEDADVPIELTSLGVAANGTIYLGGVYGNILHSVDAGKTWQYSRIKDELDYLGGSFATPDTGIFVSTILQRQCGITRVDSNFNIIDQQTFLFGMNNLYITSPSVAYAIGYGTVMKTTDRGNTWSFQDVKGDNFETMDIHGEEIWLCGYNGSIFHTTNGGNNWTRLRNGNDITLPHYPLMDIVFKDAQHGWGVCDNGKIIYTNDAGNHWEEYNQVTTNSLRSIAICPNGDLLVAGDNGYIFRLVSN
jgi:photosystem II stability/assembly factor-like uncharacterized protein